MATPVQDSNSPSDFQKELLIGEIPALAEPATASAIIKLVDAAHRLREPAASAVLETAVEAGTLFRYPPKGAKGKPRYWDRDVAALARNAIAEVIPQFTVPFTAKELLKNSVSAISVSVIKLTEKDITPLLHEMIEAGTLFSVPGGTAKAPPRYFHEDVTALAHRALQAAIASAEQPFTVKDLIKRTQSPIKLAEASVTPLLEAGVVNGTLFEIPPATAKGGPRYWNRDLDEYGRLLLVQFVEQKGPQPAAAIAKGLKGFTAKQVDDLLQQAVTAKQLWRHPAFGKAKKELFGKRPPSAAPYLKDIGQQLAKVLAIFKIAEIPAEEVRQSLIELIGASGFKFASLSGSASVGTAGNVAVMPATEILPARTTHPSDLLGLMEKLNSAAPRGALVGTRELRRVANMGKQEFDDAILNLARSQILSLHRHDYPASLSVSEREEYVTDGNGTFFIGVAIRQAQKDRSS